MSARAEIDLAIVSLRVSPSLTERALVLLDDVERAAAAARPGGHRRRYAVAHAATRALVAARLDTDPTAIVVTAEPGGRPLVDGVAFSIAHSGEQAVVAMAEPGVRVGVDLEYVRARTHLDRVAERVLGAAELARWRALPPRERPRAFAQRWTEVEAVLKARGTGIAGGFASARVLAPGWSCVAFDAGAGYAGAVAADAEHIVVTTRVVRLADALTRRDETGR